MAKFWGCETQYIHNDVPIESGPSEKVLHIDTCTKTYFRFWRVVRVKAEFSSLQFSSDN